APSPTDLKDPISTPHDSPPQDQPTTPHESSMPLLTTLMETCATLSQKVVELEKDKYSQSLEILHLKKRVKRLERKKNSKISGLKRLRKEEKIAAIDADEGIILVDEELDEEVVAMDVDSQGRLNQKMLMLLKRVKRLERKKNSKSSGLKRLRKVGAGQRVDSSTDAVFSAQKDASKQEEKIAAIDADEGIILVDEELDEEVVAMDVDSQGRLNQENFNAASKGVSAVSAPVLVSVVEPTMFDDEDVTMTMAQALIMKKEEKA
nr:hypothetical protein [Tanacetum cinerariifolium]